MDELKEKSEGLRELIGKGYLKQIWGIAWPTSISMLLFSMYDLVNIKWIGFLGTDAVAAASLVGNILGVGWGLIGILSTGAIALFARFLGADDKESLKRSYQQALFLGIILGLCLSVPVLIFAPKILGFFKLSDSVYQLALIYLRIFAISGFVLFLGIPFWSIWIAKGRTRLLMVVNFISVGLNILLDPVMIFPKGKMLVGTFDLGVKGAALASLFCELFALLLLLALTRKKDFPVPKPNLSQFRISLKESLRILRIGVPASISFLSRPLSTLLLQRFITGFGSAGIAGFGIGLRWMGLNWIFLMGLSTAVSSLVGRYLGAKRITQLEKMMKRAFLLGISLQVITSAFFYFFAEQLVRIMEPSPDTIQAGSVFIRWLALGMLIDTPGGVGQSALNGAGNTKPGMVVSIIAHWLIKLPLAWVLAYPLGIGLNGIWQATGTALLIEGFCLLYWYSRGHWKEHKI